MYLGGGNELSKASIKFSTDILRRLGEELNPSPAQGILELVKNAYDADATTCHIELKDVDQPGGSVKVIDYGDGMDEKGILNGWLVLGRSGKRQDTRTRLGRQPAGSKGLGRLAALRMGSEAKLLTRPRSNLSESYKLNINWEDFDGVTLVEDVELIIEKKVAKKSAKKKKSGTAVLLKKLKNKISRADVKRIARELLLLADPFNDDPAGFRPTLNAPEFADLEARVKSRYFQDADYHLHATLDENGYIKAVVSDWRGEELFIANHEEIVPGKQKKCFDCPSSVLDLWVFILDQNTFSTKQSTLGEVREWLKSFGGMHLYQNGLRVAPYGNPGNDWVEMNLLRARAPEERPGTNTSIGRVSIDDPEVQLVQKTDRSGFIESEFFSELKRFAQVSLEWMAKRRLGVAEIRRAKARHSAEKKSSRSKTRIKKAIEEASPQNKDKLEKAFAAYDRSRDREVKGLRKEVQLYRTLSTAGITAATFAHESSGNPIKVITVANTTIERRGKKEFPNEYDRVLKKPVSMIDRSISSLSVLGSATLKLVDHGKRRLGKVDLHNVITEVLSTFEPFLVGRNVEVTTKLCPGTPYLRGAEAAVESIVTNLINNSLTAFEKSKHHERFLLMQTSVEDKMFTLDVIDNGPGIEGISLKDIWLPGQTTKPNGTGLGLTIVRDAVSDLAGNVEASDHSEELGGAKITIQLPIIGV